MVSAGSPSEDCHSLINHSFDDADQTWQQYWLQHRLYYVESFRAAHNFFPETIYYTAAAPQVRIYKKESQRILDESAVIPATQANEVQDRRPDFDDSLGSGTLMEFMMNHQEKQSRRDEEQKSREQERSRRLEEEKQRLEDAQLRRDEEQRRRDEEQEMIAELRDEVRAWKSQIQQ
ncbi:hypothetical protein BGX23_008850 [Mortierella sp. AD031]|nr:hypothetical protein BGX23_008850 [Mortierella sp. AD031]